jgi:hypothetical protein
MLKKSILIIGAYTLCTHARARKESGYILDEEQVIVFVLCEHYVQ